MVGDDFDCTGNFEIDGLRLVNTCGACPEQYDVFRGGEQVGYLRLRHGYFRADYLACGGETVYDAHPYGDGIFAPFEREDHLRAAVAAINARLAQKEDGDAG